MTTSYFYKTANIFWGYSRPI